jgi:hypothetical protein
MIPKSVRHDWKYIGNLKDKAGSAGHSTLCSQRIAY